MPGLGLWSWLTGRKSTEEIVQEPGWAWMTKASGGKRRLQKSWSTTRTRPLCPPLIHASHTPSTEMNCGLVIEGDLPTLEKDYLQRNKDNVKLTDILYSKFSGSPVEAEATTLSATPSNLSERIKGLKRQKEETNYGSTEEVHQASPKLSESVSMQKHRSRKHKIKEKENYEDEQKKGDQLVEKTATKKKAANLSRPTSREKEASLSIGAADGKNSVSKHPAVSPSKENSSNIKSQQSKTPSRKNSTEREQMITTRPPKSPFAQRSNRNRTPIQTLTQDNIHSNQDNLSKKTSSLTPLNKKELLKIDSKQETLSKKGSSSETASDKSSSETLSQNPSIFQKSPVSLCSTPSRSPTPKASIKDPAERSPPRSIVTSPVNEQLNTQSIHSPTLSSESTPKTSCIMTSFILPDRANIVRSRKPNPAVSMQGKSFDLEKSIECADKNGSDNKLLPKRSSNLDREVTERVSRKDKFYSKKKKKDKTEKKERTEKKETFQEALANYFAVNKRESSQDRARIAQVFQPIQHHGQYDTNDAQIAAQINQPSIKVGKNRDKSRKKKATPSTSFDKVGSFLNEHHTLSPAGTHKTAKSERRVSSAVVHRRGSHTLGESISEDRTQQTVANYKSPAVLTAEEKSHNLISKAIANDSELARRAGSNFQTMIGRILSHDPSIFGQPEQGNSAMQPEPEHDRQTKITRKTRKQVTKELERRGTNEDGEEDTTLFRFKQQGCRIQHRDSANPDKNVDQTMLRNVQCVTKNGATTRMESPISFHHRGVTMADLAGSPLPRTASRIRRSRTVGRLSPSLWDGRISPTQMSEKLRSHHNKHRKYSSSPTPLAESPSSKGRGREPGDNPESSAAKRATLFSHGRSHVTPTGTSPGSETSANKKRSRSFSPLQ